MKKILVGDDNPKNLKSIIDLFKSDNLKIKTCNTIDEVIKEGKSQDYDYIITDLNYTTQGEEGYSVIKELAKEKNLILWTLDDSKKIKKKARKLGAKEVFGKGQKDVLYEFILDKKSLNQKINELLPLMIDLNTLSEMYKQGDEEKIPRMLQEIAYNPCEEEYSKRLEPVLKEIKDIFVDYNPTLNKVNHALSYIMKYIKN